MSESIAEQPVPITVADKEQPLPEQHEYLGGELIGHIGRISIDLSKRQSWIRK